MIKINKQAAFKIGKAVVIEGMKSVAIGAAITVVSTAALQGVNAAKGLSLDDILKGGLPNGKDV